VAVDDDSAPGSRSTIYISDSGNNRVRRIAFGIESSVFSIYHFAGNRDGTAGSGNGDNEDARLNNPLGIAIKTLGEESPLLYIADSNNHQIRVANGFGLTTYVNRDGTPSSDRSGGFVEGASPSDATLSNPSDVAVDGEGRVFILDSWQNAIRIVAPSVRVVPKPDRTPDDQVYTIARDIESFGLSVEGRDAILVSDVTTNSIIRLSGFLPLPTPTGQFDVHR
jgi:hypothetical protein